MMISPTSFVQNVTPAGRPTVRVFGAFNFVYGFLCLAGILTTYTKQTYAILLLGLFMFHALAGLLIGSEVYAQSFPITAGTSWPVTAPWEGTPWASSPFLAPAIMHLVVFFLMLIFIPRFSVSKKTVVVKKE
eukprot:TRINITY_DN751_c0_g2_i2.p1 TRINITY_DN751_c0_g2~~TRINITY_DN751_c0_g2_i2.p1  ORF type:complete len:132 (+),score=15.34 TRINITY_DN751_c0_g2_i2:441-836(+)